MVSVTAAAVVTGDVVGEGVETGETTLLLLPGAVAAALVVVLA